MSHHPRKKQKSAAAPIIPEIWEIHKARMIYLFLLPGNSVKKVQSIIKAETGFEPTEAQYVRQFNEVWGVRKNLSKSELEPILRICKDRDAAGLETVITRYGVPLSKETLYRRGNRRFESTLERIKVTTVSGISTHYSSLPEGIAIRTPSPTRTNFCVPDLTYFPSPPLTDTSVASPNHGSLDKFWDAEWSDPILFSPGSSSSYMADSTDDWMTELQSSSQPSSQSSSNFSESFTFPEPSYFDEEYARQNIPDYIQNHILSRALMLGHIEVVMEYLSYGLRFPTGAFRMQREEAEVARRLIDVMKVLLSAGEDEGLLTASRAASDCNHHIIAQEIEHIVYSRYYDFASASEEMPENPGLRETQPLLLSSPPQWNLDWDNWAINKESIQPS